MKRQIIGKNIELTEGIKERVEGEIDKLNSLLIHDKNATSIIVTLSVEHKKHICHVNINHKKDKFNVTKESSDMYKSVEEVFDVITRRIRKQKEKKLDKGRQPRPDKTIVEDEEILEEDY